MPVTNYFSISSFQNDFIVLLLSISQSMAPSCAIDGGQNDFLRILNESTKLACDGLTKNVGICQTNVTTNVTTPHPMEQK